jgi:hypothetical protein
MLFCAGVRAQETKVVKFDTPAVRVVVVTEVPHQPNPAEDHERNRILVYLDNAQMRRTDAAGKIENVSAKAGEVQWSPASVPCIIENIGPQPFRVVEIDLKDRPSRQPVPTSDLEPLKVDPKHYSLEFENDQVRVLRVRYGPLEKGVFHEHTLDHLVVYLTDQAKGKAGEIKLDGPMRHSEENPLDHPVERIAIDIK